jgi:hypothetical protein
MHVKIELPSTLVISEREYPPHRNTGLYILQQLGWTVPTAGDVVIINPDYDREEKQSRLVRPCQPSPAFWPHFNKKSKLLLAITFSFQRWLFTGPKDDGCHWMIDVSRS